MVIRFLKLTFLFALLTTSIFAQKGTLSGVVLEKNSALEVIGGNVVVAGTAVGTTTEFDGTYVLELDAGTYNIEYSYIGFQNFTAENVVINAGETTTLDVQLDDESIELESVVVVDIEWRRNTWSRPK